MNERRLPEQRQAGLLGLTARTRPESARQSAHLLEVVDGQKRQQREDQRLFGTALGFARALIFSLGLREQSVLEVYFVERLQELHERREQGPFGDVSGRSIQRLMLRARRVQL